MTDLEDENKDRSEINVTLIWHSFWIGLYKMVVHITLTYSFMQNHVFVTKFLVLLLIILWFKINENYVFQCFFHFWTFYANCVFIFHQNEIETVILRCLTVLSLDWFKSYGLKCQKCHWTILANLQRNSNCQMTISGHFLPTVYSSFTKLRSRRSFWAS